MRINEKETSSLSKKYEKIYSLISEKTSNI